MSTSPQKRVPVQVVIDIAGLLTLASTSWRAKERIYAVWTPRSVPRTLERSLNLVGESCVWRSEDMTEWQIRYCQAGELPVPIPSGSAQTERVPSVSRLIDFSPTSLSPILERAPLFRPGHFPPDLGKIKRYFRALYGAVPLLIFFVAVAAFTSPAV